MQAIILATGHCPAPDPLQQRMPSPLFLLFDRPFLQYIVENVIEQGIEQFDFVVSHFPEKIEYLLGDGTRWGSNFRFHLVGDSARPYRWLKTFVEQKPAQPILLGHADRMVQLSLDCNMPTPTLFGQEQDGEWYWSGWGLVDAETIANLSTEFDESQFAAELLALARERGKLVTVASMLSIRSYADLVQAHRQVFDKQFALAMGCREIEPGIWVARNVMLHPTARLVPPVYLCANCQIQRGARLGPYTTVGEGCIIENHSTIEHAIVFPRSYVGEGLEIKQSIVDKNLLVHIGLGSTIEVADEFILGSLAESNIRGWLYGILARMIAAVLLVAMLPVVLLIMLVLMMLRRGPLLYHYSAVILPVASPTSEWKIFRLTSFAERSSHGQVAGIRHFLFHFLPALKNIVAGNLGFIGVPLRNAEQIKALPQDWQALYLKTKSGIISEADLRYGKERSQDDLYASEAFYAVEHGLKYDMKLLALYGYRMFSRF